MNRYKLYITQPSLRWPQVGEVWIKKDGASWPFPSTSPMNLHSFVKIMKLSQNDNGEQIVHIADKEGQYIIGGFVSACSLDIFKKLYRPPHE